MPLRTPELHVLHAEQSNWHWWCAFCVLLLRNVKPRRLRLKACENRHPVQDARENLS